MDQVIRQRWGLAAIGGASGLVLHGLSQAMDRGALSDRAGLFLIMLVSVYLTAQLALTGPLTLRRAVLPAVAMAVAVAAMLWLASTGFTSVDQMFLAPVNGLAAVVLTFVPLPFLIAGLRGNWRSYPVLFTQAWSIVVRFISAWGFVGLVILVLWLSHMLLALVGMTLVGELLDEPAVMATLVGAVLGLAMAVVTEFADLVSPALVLRLLRLLLPVLLVVLVVFLVALPFRGLSGLFGGLSSAAVLMTITALAATLVTTAADESDFEATDSPALSRATQGLALILILPAALAVWAVAVRVQSYGWTPDRVAAAVLAVLGLGYGAGYLVAILRGAGWMARIRAVNLGMALLSLAAAALMLTPILSPERIAARTQLARLLEGRTTAPAADISALADWGKPGAAAMQRLREQASQPGQEALARAIKGVQSSPAPSPDDPAALRAALLAAIPVRPADAGEEVKALLDTLEIWQLQVWHADCLTPRPDGAPPCVLLLADLHPDLPGREFVALRHLVGGGTMVEGYAVGPAGHTAMMVDIAGGIWPDEGMLDRAIAGALRADAPTTRPITLNRLELDGLEMMLRP